MSHHAESRESRSLNGPETLKSRRPGLVRALGWAALVAGVVGLAAAFFASPPERVMLDRANMMYVHIGAAWTAYLAYGVTAVGAVMYLIRRDAKWDRLALASAELGVVLTTITLATGSLWGRAVSGWWWQWSDLRLVLTLFLWFLYVAYLILRQFTRGESRATVSAVLAVAGVPAMVLNHFAVSINQTFHPSQVVVRPGGAAVDPAFLNILLLSLVAYSLAYAYLLVERIDLEARYQP